MLLTRHQGAPDVRAAGAPASGPGRNPGGDLGAAVSACRGGHLEFLVPVLAQRGLVLELGAGTGLLTRELVAAGHRVIATDASAAMLDVARELVGESVAELRQLTLPDDPVPAADAIVAIGHPLNYLPDA